MFKPTDVPRITPVSSDSSHIVMPIRAPAAENCCPFSFTMFPRFGFNVIFFLDAGEIASISRALWHVLGVTGSIEHGEVVPPFRTDLHRF